MFVTKSIALLQIVLAWVNRHLLEREMRVRNLSKSFRDGTVLLNLLEVLSGYKIKSFNKKPADKKEIVRVGLFCVVHLLLAHLVALQVENMALIQKFLKVLQIDTVFDPDDVMSGDSVAVVQILLKLIDHFKEQTGKQATVNALKSTPRTDSVMDLRADSGILRVFAAKSQENKCVLSPVDCSFPCCINRSDGNRRFCRGRRGVKIDSVAIDIGSSEIAASEHEDPLPPPPSPKETKTSGSFLVQRVRLSLKQLLTVCRFPDGSSSPADEAPKKAKTKKPKSPRDGIKLEIKIEPATSDEVTVKPAPIAPEALAPSNAELRPLRRLQSAINRLTVENDEEISFDDLDEALLKQDILDLDSFDIGEADVALSEKPSSEESTDDLLDDLSKVLFFSYLACFPETFDRLQYHLARRWKTCWSLCPAELTWTSMLTIYEQIVNKFKRMYAHRVSPCVR
jgi:hypothetical protein